MKKLILIGILVSACSNTSAPEELSTNLDVEKDSFRGKDQGYKENLDAQISKIGDQKKSYDSEVRNDLSESDCRDRQNIFKPACANTKYTSEFDDAFATGNWLSESDYNQPSDAIFSTWSSFLKGIQNLSPGAIIELDDGRFDGEVLGLRYFTIRAKGTKENPITIRARHPGKTIFNNMRVYIYGEWIRFEGFSFKDHFNNSDHGAAISLGSSEPETGCFHCTLSNIRIENYNPKDIHAPHIILRGENPQNLLLNESYSEPGATCHDDYDSTCQVQINGKVDTTKVGNYPLEYTTMDSAKNPMKLIRMVNVTRSKGPIIDMGWQNPFILQKDSVFTFPKVSAKDPEDGMVNVVTSDSVDNSKIGQSPLRYSATDKDGNITKAIRTVHVRNSNKTLFVTISGKWARITRSSFINKKNVGGTIGTFGRKDVSQEGKGFDYHLIDHNYFKDRPYVGDVTGISNGYETIAMYSDKKENGIKTKQWGYYWAPLHSFIRHNYFSNNSGEGELFSIKGNNVAVQFNTFEACGGSVSLRASNNSLVEGNVFYSYEQSGRSGGVRVVGENHLIIHNLFEVLNSAGYKHSYYYPDLYPLTLQVGDKDPLARDEDGGQQYFPVKNTLIGFNLFAYNNVDFYFGYRYGDSSLFPNHSIFAYNLIYQGSNSEKQPPSNLTYAVPIPGTQSYFPQNMVYDNRGENNENIEFYKNQLFGKTSISGFSSLEADSIFWDKSARLYLPQLRQPPQKGETNFILFAQREKYRELLDRPALSAFPTQRLKEVLYMAEGINKCPIKSLPLQRYTSEHVGTLIGVKN